MKSKIKLMKGLQTLLLTALLCLSVNCLQVKAEDSNLSEHNFSYDSKNKPDYYNHTLVCEDCEQTLQQEHTYDEEGKCEICGYIVEVKQDGDDESNLIDEGTLKYGRYPYGNKVYVYALVSNTKDIVCIPRSVFWNKYMQKYTVMEINPSAFADHPNIKMVILNSNIEKIGSKAFKNCTGLTNIYIPSSVSEMGEDAFIGCTNLERIDLDCDSPLIPDASWGIEVEKIQKAKHIVSENSICVTPEDEESHSFHCISCDNDITEAHTYENGICTICKAVQKKDETSGTKDDDGKDQGKKDTTTEKPSEAPSQKPSEAPNVTPSKAPTLKMQTITVAKAAKKTVTFKASKLKAKKATLKLGAKAKTKLTYKVTKYPKKANKYISVSSKGVVTMKKGAKKGTYKVTITAKADKKYAKATKVITIKVK